MTNPTAENFGYPRTKVAETESWLVLVRPKQPTFGSLVLVCKESVESFSQLSPAAFADLKTATEGVERLLGKVVAYEKINYLMLMMVDKDVHFHVIPCYAGTREHEGRTFADAGWPDVPALGSTVDLDPDAAERLAQSFAQVWSAA